MGALSPLKDKKKVTFNYIPPYKDEDDEEYERRAAAKGRKIKDLPTIPADVAALEEAESKAQGHP